MLATQNRPQLERNDIPRPMPGQIRQWVDRHELSRLLMAEIDVRSLFSVTPQCNRGVLRVINAHKLLRALSAICLCRVGVRSNRFKRTCGSAGR